MYVLRSTLPKFLCTLFVKLIFDNAEAYLSPFLDGKNFIFGETEQLIKYSSGVICHFSGAINFAIIHHKPILFFLSKKWTNHRYLGTNTLYYSENISKKIEIIEDNEKPNFFYNKDIYDNYCKKFILNERNHLSIAKVISDNSFT